MDSSDDMDLIEISDITGVQTIIDRAFAYAIYIDGVYSFLIGPIWSWGLRKRVYAKLSMTSRHVTVVRTYE